MKFHFTTTDHLYSRLIRWGLGEDCSHFAVEFSLPDGNIIVESIIEKGVTRCSVEDFMDRNRVVHTLEYVGDCKDIDRIFYDKMKCHDKDHYDTTAIAFWAVCAITKRLFNKDKPIENPWGKEDEHYCVEVLDGAELIIYQYLGIDVTAVDWEMTSPHQAYEILKLSNSLRTADFRAE